MRCVLGLFEGVVTGAADGYWRIARKPAATLLHLGPGLANGLANLHNAKKARTQKSTPCLPQTSRSLESSLTLMQNSLGVMCQL
jgi:hypothetical protein